jgi:hypothetical protein
MDSALIGPGLMVAAYCGYYGFRLWQCSRFRKEAQTQAEVKEIYTVPLFALSPKVLLEYADQQGTLHHKKIRPYGYRTYKVGDKLDIAYQAAKPENITVWNGQEAMYRKILFWVVVASIAFFASVPYMKDYSAKQAAIKASSSHNNP